MKKNIHSKKILSIIPARGGSKRIPRKNLIEFGGIPLIGHSIFHSIKSSLISKTIVSSDDEEILNYSKTFDNVIALKRPKNIRKPFKILGNTTFGFKSLPEPALKTKDFYQKPIQT